MHHSLIKTSTLILSLLLIITASSCFSHRSNISIDEKKYETDKSIVNLQMPEFKNMSDANFQQELNSSYNQMVESWLADFSKQCEKNSSETEKYQFRLTQKITYQTQYFLSVVGEIYILTDGVHGSSSRVVKNIDVASNHLLKLADLFQDESFETAINREINNIMEKNPEEYHDLWEKPTLSSQHENFYLSDDGLVIFYPPYELSYYARGFVEFCIPYKKLAGYWKPEYNNILVG